MKGLPPFGDDGKADGPHAQDDGQGKGKAAEAEDPEDPADHGDSGIAVSGPGLVLPHGIRRSRTAGVLVLPTLPHMTCRDRNLNATKALLLGLYAEGVREVLAITGDPIPSAERDEVKSVYQFNSRKLAQYIVSLAGEGREMPSPLTVFGALNLNARNFDVELRRAVEKLENGMTGFLTQPVLSEQAVQNLQQARQTLGPEAKILAGILPVVSQRNAIFMENEVNGIHVDAEIIERFAGLDRAQGEELGLEVSVKAAQAAAPYADGFYLMTPFNRVALMERLIARLRTEVTG